MEFNKAYNRAEFLEFLKGSFLPEEDFTKEETVLSFPVQTKYCTKATRLGSCHDSLDLEVYEILHTSKHDARVGLSKEAFRLLAEQGCTRALVLFVPQDDNSNYRFSLIEITLKSIEDSSKVDKTYSNPHRYSYFLGKDIAYYTPNKYLNAKGRVKDSDDLRDRFSVEILTKEFYSELSDWYAWAITQVRFPNDINDDNDDAKFNTESTIRLITRLIFVWFLKQRHLVPDEFFDETFIADKLLKDFESNRLIDTLGNKNLNSHYYKAILQNLFFAMLNCPITKEGSDEITERKFKDGRSGYDDNKLMRYKDLFKDPDLFVKLANETVPFLNGGLFDCLDDKDNGMYYDGFSDREKVQNALIVPDFLFFGEEAGKNIDLSDFYGDKKKKKVSARGIIDILKRYNFTVEENTPFDQEVSLDPELLGKVFENLLASYNPETQTTARKQTGSFYTPREIVQYMVDESLVAHLKRTVGEEYESEYRELMQYTDDEINLSDEIKHKIITSLYNCKVLDPACGSGAFPMGMLQQMVHILSRIDPNNEQWKNIMMEDAIAATSDAYRNSTDNERKDVVADIERSFDEAVNRPDYARKLYLIENCIYGVDIQPIAIQISKLRFFISLVVDQITNTDAADNFGIRPLPNLEAKFVAANTLIGLNKRETSLFDSDLIKQKEKEMAIAKHKIFGAKTVKTKRKYKEQVKTIRLEIANLLKENEIVGNEEARELAQWDMFDQNASSPFFDPEWMFDVKNGFDIAIGNPPYRILTKNNTDNLLLANYIVNFKSIRKSYSKNLYTLFIELAVTKLTCKNGLLSFIVPEGLYITRSYKDCVEVMNKEGSTLQTVTFSNYVFENAITGSLIFLYIKGQNCDTKFFHCNADYKIQLRTDTRNSILDKMEKSAKPLKTIATLFKGMVVSDRKETISDNNVLPDMFILGKNIAKWNILDCFWTDYSLLKIVGGTKSLTKQNHIPRILIRRTGNTLCCALLEKKALTESTLYSCWSNNTDKISNKYLLAILNSKLLDYYNKKLNITNQQGFPQILMTDLEELPIIIDIPNVCQTKIVSLVDNILNIKHKDPNADTSKYEQDIDGLVYHLYNLIYDEVKVIDPENPITKEEYEENCI
jgi:adenine-specific DNA-methyltransferase